MKQTHLRSTQVVVFKIKITSQPGLYPSTFADSRFRKEDSVFVTHECSPGGLGAKSLKAFAI
jgi:hypothetical protein